MGIMWAFIFWPVEAPLPPAPVPQRAPAPQFVRVIPQGAQRAAWYRGEDVGPRTCASRIYPRGTWLILEAGGVRLPVRVNDYGPADAATGTLIDVSADVARDLGFMAAGHGTVKVYKLEVPPREQKSLGPTQL